MNDLKFAFRQLLKNPGFSAIVLLTLALGVGAVSAVFSLVQAVLLTPPPYFKPEQIVLISSVRTTGEPYSKGSVAAQWQEWRTEAKSFTEMAGYGWTLNFLLSPDGSESVPGLMVTPDFFKVIGIQPQIGRVFLPSDIPPTNAQPTVVILGHELWQRRFHGNSNIIGQVIHFNWNGSLTVVGVMPPNLRVLPSPTESHLPRYDPNAHVDYWLPASPDDFGPMGTYWAVAGRLRDGARLEAAQAELTAIAARQAQEYSALEGLTAKAVLLPTSMNSEARRLLMPPSGAVMLVFLIACGNVTGLLLARGLQRQREYAVRCALGAGRWRLASQSLTESLLLALSGGVLGAVLAVVTVKVLKATAGVAIPRLDAVTIGWPMLAFGFAVALLAAVVAGFVPAFRASWLNAATAAKGGTTVSANRADRKFLGGVAMAQTALTLVLLVGAGLLIRTVANLAQIQPGYDIQRIAVMTVMPLRWAQQPGVANDQEKWVHRFIDFHQRALAQVATFPGVKSAAWACGIPLTGHKWMATVQTGGYGQTGKFKDEIDVPVRLVSPEYFDTIGMQLLAGRNFRSTDTFANECNVALINQAMAGQYFANTDPIGKKFRFSFQRVGKFSDVEIIGLVADSRNAALTMKAEPEFYLSYWHVPTPFKSLVIRTTGDPRSVIVGVQKVLRAVDPRVAIEDVRTFEQIRNDSIAPQLFTMRLLICFSILAGTLALIGVYGVLSLSVASRRQEMAIRMAVGAQRRNVFALILSEGLRLVGAGVVIGAAVAIASTGVLRALLFGVEPTDPLTFATMVLLFVAVAVLACYIPARRASKVDPIAALRYE